MKKMNKKGFTLIEMLAVIAIIAVLVAIVIPTVSSATEKAKEAADVANIRSAVATVTTNALAGGEDATLTTTVTMTQGKAGFVNTDLKSIGGISSTPAEGATKSDFQLIAEATEGAVVTITADRTGTVSVTVTAASTGNS